MLDTFLNIVRIFSISLVGISLFMAPFYGIFIYRNRKLAIVDFSSSLERFFKSPEANALVFFWALGEATVWFVIPEFLLALVLFMRVERKFQLVIYDILGTIVGTIIAINIHLSASQIASLPFIKPKMLTQVYDWYEQLGVFGLIYQPFSGVPYKVFTFQAAHERFFIIGFIVLAISVRLARYFLAYSVLKALYPVLHRYVSRHYIWLYVSSIFIFSLLLLRISNMYR